MLISNVRVTHPPTPKYIKITVHINNLALQTEKKNVHVTGATDLLLTNDGVGLALRESFPKSCESVNESKTPSRLLRGIS